MKDYKNRKWLYSKYIGEGLSSYEIANLQECTSTTIRNWLKKYTIQTRDAGYYTKSDISKMVLQDLYTKQYKTIAEVAEILSVSQNTIIKYLRKYGIKSRTVCDYPSFLEGHIISREKIKGNPRSLQTRIKISKTKTHGEWKGFSNLDSIFRQYRNKPEYKNWRQNIFERDDFTCQECGKQRTYLELHHIIPLRNYEDGIMKDDNAITLCRSCHGKTKAKEYEFVEKYKTIVGVV